MIRTDSAGGTHAFLDWLSRRGRWLSYSVGMTITDAIHQAVLKIPKKAWTPAYDPGGTERPGAWVAEITDMPDLSTWPTGMRLIVRKERPHPGAQLRFTDLDGLRLTCFATTTKGGQLADLELRHRRRARCEDRIRKRPAQPPPARHRPEPDLAGDRPARPRPAGLDAHARADRRNSQVGAPPSPAPSVLRSRPDRHDGPPPAPEIRTPLALDRRHHRRPDATRRSPEPRLTSRSTRPCERTFHPGAVEPRRSPDTTLGPKACPTTVIGNEMGHRLRRRPT